MKPGRTPGGRRRDGRHEERVPLVGDGDLGAERHLVDGAGDAVPVVPGDAEDAQIADGDEKGRQGQAEEGVDGAVERAGRAPAAVAAEVRGAAAQARDVAVGRHEARERRQTEQEGARPGDAQAQDHSARRHQGRVVQGRCYRVVPVVAESRLAFLGGPVVWQRFR